MRPLERCWVVLVSAPSAVKQVAARTIVSVFSGSVLSARTSSACVASGAGGRGAGASWARRGGFGCCCVSCCGCGRDCGGGAWVTGPLPLAGDGVSEPDDRKVEGVPSNRGISSGVTTSTTIASGRGAWDGFALTRNSPTIRAPKWPMAETTSPGRLYRFNPFIWV